MGQDARHSDKGRQAPDMNGYNISYEHTGVGYSKKFVYKDAVNDNAEYLYYLDDGDGGRELLSL